MPIAPGLIWSKKFRHKTQRPNFKQGPSNVPLPIQPIRLSSSWVLNRRFYKRLPVTWELRSAVVKQKSSYFRALNHITVVKSCTWSLEKRLFGQEQIRFRDYYKIRTFVPAGIRFRVLRRFPVLRWQLQGLSPGNISTGIVHPVDFSTPNLQPQKFNGLGTPIVKPIDYDNYPGYGQVSLPGITFRVGLNPAGRVQCIHAVTFRDMSFVTAGHKIAWTTTGREGLKSMSQFNVYNSVANRTIIEWNIGRWVPSHIRQTAQTRIDFAY